MDIHLSEGAESPKPREEVRIQELETVVYPDRFRIFIHIRVMPFLERPNLLITARNAEDRVVSELSIIETMHNDMEFTMHLRNVQEPAGEYTLTADLYYESRNPPQDRRTVTFVVPEATE
jgi:hypothetical protein